TAWANLPHPPVPEAGRRQAGTAGLAAARAGRRGLRRGADLLRRPGDVGDGGVVPSLARGLARAGHGVGGADPPRAEVGPRGIGPGRGRGLVGLRRRRRRRRRVVTSGRRR
ncbi:unnamed protein product, partial [Ectocarpus sp. 6 AP-2014]